MYPMRHPMSMPMRRMPPNQPQQRNFGSDLHAFMDGLNRIVQILYSSIPVLELLKVVVKYSAKFCNHLGESLLSTLKYLKVPVPSVPSNTLEAVWETPSQWRHAYKLGWILIGALLLYNLYYSKREHKQAKKMQEVWDQETPIHPTEEERPVFEEYYPEYPEDYEEYLYE